MKHLCVLLCALLFCSGCGSDAEKRQWDEAMKDWRGDNMQMRGLAGMNDTDNHPPTPPSRD